MRLVPIGFSISTIALAIACGSPDIKLGEGEQNQNTGGTAGSGGSSGSSGTGGSGGEPSACTSDVVGSPGVCSSVDELKAQASALCAQQNTSLADIAYDGSCDPGWATFAKVVCCGDAPPVPPPPPPECIYDVVGAPGQCALNGELEAAAKTQCAAANLALVEIGYDNACGVDASNFAKYTCCAGGQPPPPPEPCFGELVGDPVSCTSNDDLKLKAYYVCDGAGATLTDLTLGDECSPESSHYAKVECCFPPPPPPPGECFGDFVGEPETCLENAALQTKAEALCASQNAKLETIDFDGACGPTASNTAKFTCCGEAQPPPPPPPVCSPESVATPACVGNDVLAAEAKQICATKNAAVEGLAFDEACAPESSQSAKFLCCAGVPPPPPPSCWSAGVGSSSCVSNDSFKQMANDDCNSVGAELAAISYDNACGPDSSSSAKYTCCSPQPL